MNILNNPFNVLGVSQRDKISKIIEVAEEKSLFEDSNVCNDAKNILINALSRVKAEINWLPGVTPTKIQQIIKYIEETTDLKSVVYNIEDMFKGYGPIVYMNIEKTFLEKKTDITKEDMYLLIYDIAKYYEDIVVYDLLDTINCSRRLCGMATINDVDIIERELNNYKTDCIEVFMHTINTLSGVELVDLVTELIDKTTSSGENYAPELIYCVVDGYEIRVKDFIDKKEESLYVNINEILKLDFDKLNESTLKNLVDNFIDRLRDWDKFAQPIQLRSMSKGERYESAELGEASRRIAIELFNNGYEDMAEDFLSELNSIFAEVGNIVELIESDKGTIADIKRKREEQKINAEENYQKWLKDIRCDEIVGTVFKSHVIINENGIYVKGNFIKLEDVTAIKFGSTSQTVVTKTYFSQTEQTSTTYNFGIMSATNELKIKFHDTTPSQKHLMYSSAVSSFFTGAKGKFDKIKNSLLCAVGNQIIQNIVAFLKQGKQLKIGKMTVHNDYVIIPKTHFFTSDEYIKCSWDDVDFDLVNGSLTVKATCRGMDDISYDMPLATTYNAYLFYVVVQMFYDSDADTIGDTLD